MTTSIYTGLNIPQAIRGNRSNLPWLFKNLFTDTLSFRERSRIAQAEVLEALGNMRARDIVDEGYKAQLERLSEHRGACLAVARKLLTEKRKGKEIFIEHLADPRQAWILVDVLALFPGSRAYWLVKKIIDYVPDPMVREKATRTAVKKLEEMAK